MNEHIDRAARELANRLNSYGLGDDDDLVKAILGLRQRKRVYHPVSLVIEHFKCTPSVAARLERMNPNGIEEGSIPRGWHRKFRYDFSYGVITPKEFIRREGVEAYRLVPRELWIRHGLRKAMRRTDYLDNVWKVS